MQQLTLCFTATPTAGLALGTSHPAPPRIKQRLHWRGWRGELTNDGCGRIAIENTNLAFWQSRNTLVGLRADVPDLTDIPALAAAIRKAYS